MDLLDDGSDQEEMGVEVNEDDLLGGSDDEEVSKSESVEQTVDEPLVNEDAVLQDNDEDEEYLDLNLGDEYDSLVLHSDTDYDSENRISPVKVRHVQQKKVFPTEEAEAFVEQSTESDVGGDGEGDDQETYEGGDGDKESNLGESFDADVDIGDGDDDQDVDEDEGKSRRARFHTERKPEDLPNNSVSSEKPQQIRSLGDQRYGHGQQHFQHQRPRMWGNNVRPNGSRPPFHRGFHPRGPRPRIPVYPQQRHGMIDAPIQQFNEPIIIDFNQPVRPGPPRHPLPTAPVPPIRQEVGIVRPQPVNPQVQHYHNNPNQSPRGGGPARPQRPWKPPQHSNGPPPNHFPEMGSPNSQSSPYPNGLGQPRPPMQNQEPPALRPPQPIPLPEPMHQIPSQPRPIHQPRHQYRMGGRMRSPMPGPNFQPYPGGPPGQFHPFPPNRPMQQPFHPVPPFPNMDHSPGQYNRFPPPYQGPPQQMWNGGDMNYQQQFSHQSQPQFPPANMYQQQQSPTPYMEQYVDNYGHTQYSHQSPFPGSVNYQPHQMNQNVSPMSYNTNYDPSPPQQYNNSMREMPGSPSKMGQMGHGDGHPNQAPQKRRTEEYIPLEKGKERQIPSQRPKPEHKTTVKEDLANKIIVESKKEMGLDDNYMRQIEEQKRKREEILRQKAQKRRQEKDDGSSTYSTDTRSSSKIYLNPDIINPNDLTALGSNLKQVNKTSSMSSSGSGSEPKPKKPKTILRVTKNKKGEIIHMEKLLKVEKK